MASLHEDVGQLLSSKAATPIAQLSPDLPDLPTRSLHGEVTITWPYSAVTKSFAFLLAEPDFRLRRDRGSVRIHLSGPSAEAVGRWELGGGDEVTLSLDGVEWARDEEPVRPPGSRIEWQLRFAGKLVLKATLGETSETKSINIDQPVPVGTEAPEAFEPIPFAEIDTTIFDDEPAVEKRPSRPAAANEFASPIFAKRSRASYGPLFELDLEDELEEDGGRRGKGRKRSRYSVQNRMWRYREDSSSPEPEVSQDSPSGPSAQNGDAGVEDTEMEDTSAKPNMTDGGCQTNESELAPHPSSAAHTPVKAWTTAATSPSFGVGSSQPPGAARFDAGAQAPPPGPVSSLSDEDQGRQVAPNAPNPFGLASNSTGFPHQGFGMPQSPTPSTNQVFGQSSLFQAPSTSASNQLKKGSGGASSLFGTAPNGQPPQVPGQSSSLFGTGPAPTPSVFSQAASAGSGSGLPGGSLRFGFGQEPQPALGTSPFAASQPSTHQPDPHPYPESYLDRDETMDHAPSAPQDAFGGSTQDVEHQHGFLTNDRHGHPRSNTTGQEGLPWPVEPQAFDASQTSSRLGTTEDLRSDGSDVQSTPPGMVPPHVEDGTRNADEMRREGLLSRPVYRQGVPQGALPDDEDASAGENSMDSDGQAYDETEKGDDYDLRNYDRVSDDEEGFDEQGPLPDDELMGEDEESLGEEEDFEEDDYDEEDYEEENHYSQAARWPPQAPPQPRIQKEPIVIDLLSDSDDDEAPPVVQAPRRQTQQQQPSNLVKNESEKDGRGYLNQESRPYMATQSQQEDFRSQQDEEDGGSDEEVADYLDDEAEESLEEDEDAFGDLEGSEEECVEPAGHEPQAGDSLVQEATPTVGAVESAAEVEAINVAFDRTHERLRDNSEEIIEEEVHAEIATVGEQQVIQQQTDGADDGMDLDEEHCNDTVGSFQTQPAEMLASLQTQTTVLTNPAFSPPSHDAAHENVEHDFDHEEAQAEASKEDQRRSSKGDVAEDSLESGPASKPPEEVIETYDEESEKNAGHETGEATKLDDAKKKQLGGSGEQGDVPPSPPESQDPEVDAEPKISISMTTVTSHVETQPSSQQETTSGTQETELTSTQVAGDDANHMDTVQDKDTEMVDAGTPVKVDSFSEQATGAQQHPLGEDGEDKDDTPEEPGASEPRPESERHEAISATSPQRKEGSADDNLAVEERQPIFAQIDGTHEDEGEQPQGTPEMPEVAKSPPAEVLGADASFATAASQASETPGTEEAGVASTEKPRRGSRKTRLSFGSKSARSATISRRGQRQSPSQQAEAPCSQRTTRSKTMSFQQSASPREDKEDMSIQLARAALRSPSAKTKRKVSATTAQRLNTDLTKRLDNDMPDCVPLRDLKKYNSRTLDVAAVVTSAHTPPKRTVTREYASSFTITDPSLAPDGVVEVDLYSLHRDHLPVVKVGDAVLLRAFTVVSLPGRGFGLKTDKDESSWAVFEADAEDEPQMRAAPVEMNEQERKFLLDLRAWHAGLDEGTREKLGRAVGVVIEKGRESRAKK